MTTNFDIKTAVATVENSSIHVVYRSLHSENDRVMSTGFVHKGEKITFAGTEYEALQDARFMPMWSEIYEGDAVVFGVFTKCLANGEIVLCGLTYERGMESIDDACWWPTDGWDESKPTKEDRALAKDAGLQLKWNGRYTTIIKK